VWWASTSETPPGGKVQWTRLARAVAPSNGSRKVSGRHHEGIDAAGCLGSMVATSSDPGDGDAVGGERVGWHG
jgi:hypothetical protein